MDHKIVSNFLAIGLFVLALAAPGQERRLARANEKYGDYNYIDAAEIYEDVVASGFKSVELLQKLGNTYYFNARYGKAETAYAQLFELSEDVAPVYYLRYAQSLRANGKEREAKQFYDRYVKKGGMTKPLVSAKDYLQIIKENSGRYQIKNLDINTAGIDFGGGTYQNQLVYASTRDTGVIMKRRSGWDGLSFLNLYKAEIAEGGEGEPDGTGESVKIKGQANSKFHESSAVFTKDGQTMYFTRNNLAPGKKSKKETQLLKIYRATLKDGKWANMEDLSINGDTYSTAHPALSPDEGRLYFSSDRPEAMGGPDIFYAEIDSDGSLGPVESPGGKVNTPGRETFPFVSNENGLYFSSDGHFGLGGLDVFYTDLKKERGAHLLNVGEPVNSPFDDFAYTIDTETGRGFFSSNRTGENAKGHDDIYSLLEKEKIKDLLATLIYGTVTDKDTRGPIPGASIRLLDEENKLLKEVFTDSLGNYEIEADRYKKYLIRASKEAYDTDEQLVGTTEERNEANFELKRNVVPLEPGRDLAEVLNIPIIYFDFDKSNIREDAAVELEKLVAALNRYPELKIDIRSHTDSRGSDSYNKALSGRRAQSTMEYIIGRGISKDRLTAKGHGESQLANRCGNGVKCSEEEHQANRRSEFIVAE